MSLDTMKLKKQAAVPLGSVVANLNNNVAKYEWIGKKFRFYFNTSISCLIKYINEVE